MRGWAEWCEPFGEGLWHPVNISHRSGRTGTPASRAGLPAHRHFVWRSRPRCERRDGRTWWLRYIDARNVDCRSLIIVMQDSLTFIMYYLFLARKKGAKSSNALNIFNLNAAKQQNISDFACTYSDVSPWVQVLTWTPVSPEKWSWPTFPWREKRKNANSCHTPTTMPRCPRWSCSGTGCRGSSVGFESETRIESIWNHMKSIWNPYEIHATISTILIS